MLRLIDLALRISNTWLASPEFGVVTAVSGGAELIFAASNGRCPEVTTLPSLTLGGLAAFLSTTASLVAVVDSILGGAGLALLVGARLGRSLTTALISGLVVAAALMVLFHWFQKKRFTGVDLGQLHLREKFHRG